MVASHATLRRVGTLLQNVQYCWSSLPLWTQTASPSARHCWNLALRYAEPKKTSLGEIFTYLLSRLKSYTFLCSFNANKKFELYYTGKLPISVAELPLFWTAPALAPDGQGPGADSGLLWLAPAPAPGKKRQLQVALAPYTKIFHFKLSKS